MLRAKLYDRALLVSRSLILGLCLFTLLGGHYPPIMAQAAATITVEDAVQDTNIEALNKHLAATDDRVQKQWDAMQKMATDIAGIQGEERLIGILLGSGMGISIFLQVKKREV